MNFAADVSEYGVKFEDLNVGEFFVFEVGEFFVFENESQVYLKCSTPSGTGCYAVNIKNGKFMTTVGTNWINQQNVIPMMQKNDLELERA
jgi:hypothetical protein